MSSSNTSDTADSPGPRPCEPPAEALVEQEVSESTSEPEDIDAKMSLLAHPKADKIGGVRRPHHAHGHQVVAAELGIVEEAQGGLALPPHPPSPRHATKITPSTFHPPKVATKHEHERPKETPLAYQDPGSRYYQKGHKVRQSDIRAAQEPR